MKKVIIGFLVGLVVGAIVTTWLFAMNEYGYFDSPRTISADALSSRIKQSESDSHGQWSIEPSSDSLVLLEYQLPMKREQFLVDRALFNYLGPLDKKVKLRTKDGKLVVSPMQ